MLTQLDILIGFVVVMSIVSLMIMIATQISASALGLRGKNLRDALETLLHEIAPRIDPDARGHLIDATLINPLASDTILSTAKGEGFFQRYVPLVRWFCHRWARATAIRPDELLKLVQSKATSPIAGMLSFLERMRAALAASTPANAPDAFRPALDALAKVLAQPPPAAAAPHSVSITFRRLNADRAEAVPAPPPSPDPVTDIAHDIAVALAEFRRAVTGEAAQTLRPEILADLKALDAGIDAALVDFDAALDRIKTPAQRHAVLAIARAAREVVAVVQAGQQITQDEHDRFEKWFNTAQDRAQQWFTMHTRIITVIASIIAAFVLQLDTFKVFHLLAMNPDIRAKLVARADSLQQQEQATAQQAVTADMNKSAFAELAKNFPDWTPPSDQFPLGLDLAGAKQWFAAQLEAKASPKNNAIFAAYGQALLRQQLDANTATLQALARETSASTLQLMPSPYPFDLQWQWKHWYWPFAVRFNDGSNPPVYWSWPKSHLLGILISAALLSLGSPFWFSLLKNLTSLRPALAAAIDNNPKTPTSTELKANA